LISAKVVIYFNLKNGESFLRCKFIETFLFFALFAKQRGQVERSNDRVSRSARDINANALAQMHGGSTHPADAALGDPLCFAKRVGKVFIDIEPIVVWQLCLLTNQM
jgi:hypothetical protein